MPWVDRVIINSEHVREFAISVEHAPADRITLIPNGVVPGNFENRLGTRDLSKSNRSSEDRIMLGSVGRLDRQKGFDILLDAFALLPTNKFELTLIGNGDQLKNLRMQARDLGVENRVRLLGFRHDIPLLLSTIDLYVQPSRFEGMPNALLEAMAAGRPIIASAVDGIRELIRDGEHGWLVPPDNPVELAQAIQAAARHPEEANRRASLAQQRVKTQYSVDRMLDAWERVFQESHFVHQ